MNIYVLGDPCSPRKHRAFLKVKLKGLRETRKHRLVPAATFSTLYTDQHASIPELRL